MYEQAIKFTMSVIILLASMFALTHAQDISDRQPNIDYYISIQGGADASITGDICAVSGSTDFGLIFSWKPEHTKTKNSLQTGLILSCSYNFFDGWLLAGCVQTGLAQTGYIMVGTAWYCTTQELYIQNALMIPFTELTHKTSNVHSYMIVTYYIPISWLTGLDAGIPSDTIFKKLYIGMRLRLSFYGKQSS